MERLRWGAVLSVVGGALLFSGCQMPWKCISRSEYDNLRQLQRLNEEQSSRMTSLIYEKERLTDQLNAALTQSGMAKKQLENQEKLMAELQNRIGNKGPMEGAPGGGEIITNTSGEVGIRYGADLLFDPGQATLKPEGEQRLKEAADALRDKPNGLRICGYTDSSPIKVSGWKSNFELSGARALAVLEALKKDDIEPSRMHFAGYGEYSLIYDASGKEDMKKSRRAEIFLINETGATAPAETAPAKGAPMPVVVPK